MSEPFIGITGYGEYTCDDMLSPETGIGEVHSITKNTIPKRKTLPKGGVFL